MAAAVNNEGLPGDSVLKNLLVKHERRVPSLSHEHPLEKEMTPRSSILAGESHG